MHLLKKQLLLLLEVRADTEVCKTLSSIDKISYLVFILELPLIDGKFPRFMIYFMLRKLSKTEYTKDEGGRHEPADR